MSTSEGQAVQQNNSGQMAGFVECSAKTLNNYKAAFDKAITAVMQRRASSAKNGKKTKKKGGCAMF